MPDPIPSEDQDHDRFIPGVYNYCDRWCERCRFNNRCLTHHVEQQRKALELLHGPDADALGMVFREVEHRYLTSSGRREDDDEPIGSIVGDDEDFDEWSDEDEDFE